MKRLIRLVSVMALLVALTACASGMKFTEMNPSLEPASPDAGRIFFYRVTSLGAALNPDVKLNGETVGNAQAMGFFFVDRPAGHYEVVTSTEVKRKVSFVLEPGQTRYIRFNVSLGFFVGHVFGELVDDATGREEIQKCKYTGVAAAATDTDSVGAR
jgi:hypothetical protein